MPLRKVLQVYRWVILIAVIYLVVLFAFGGIYYWLYLHDRQSFAFNADIQRAQSEIFKTTMVPEINVLEPEIQALSQLSEKLKLSEPIKLVYPPPPQLILINPSTVQPIQPRPLIWPQAEFETADFKLVFHKETLTGQGSTFLISVDFYDHQKKIGTQNISHFTMTFPDQAAQYQELVTVLSSDLQALLVEDQRRLLTLAGPNPEIWTYGDFFYFSVITQTTVGYGDILPNNTTIRICVSIQVLLGLFLVTFGIGFAFRALRSSQSATH
jgi:hypothetical protein